MFSFLYYSVSSTKIQYFSYCRTTLDLELVSLKCMNTLFQWNLTFIFVNDILQLLLYNKTHIICVLQSNTDTNPQTAHTLHLKIFCQDDHPKPLPMTTTLVSQYNQFLNSSTAVGFYSITMKYTCFHFSNLAFEKANLPLGLTRSSPQLLFSL